MDKRSNSCRSCLTTAATPSYSIYKDISPQTYLFCTSIEVKYDELPKTLCGTCYQLIIKYAEFKHLCIQSENKLRELAQSLPSNNRTDTKLKIEIQDNGKAEERETLEVDFCEDIVPAEKTGISVLKLDKSTENIANVRKPKKSQKYNFKCGQCNRRFAFKERLDGHILEHQGKEASIQCPTCNRTFTRWATLRTHVESVHSRLPFTAVTCPVCSKVCKTPVTLRTHLNTHKDRPGRVCEECGRTFKTNVTFKNHLQTHIKNRQQKFTCPHCGKKYISKKTRAKHIYRRHTDKQFICNYCNNIFTEKANLIRHIMAHEGRRPKYKCDLCLKTLTSHASLIVHRRIHSGERPFSCSYCFKGFKDKGGLVEHERIHSGDKPFQCPVCVFQSSRRWSLRRHIKVHTK